MNLGLRNRHSSSDAVPAISTRPGDRSHQARLRASGRAVAPIARHTSSSPTPSEPLTSTRSPGSGAAPGTIARPPRASATQCDSPSNALGDRRGQRPDRDQQLDAGAGDVLAELGVVAALVGPELEHVSEHRDAPRGAGPRRGVAEVLEGGAHRHRVGVVAAIDQRHAAGQRHAARHGPASARARRAPSGVTPTARAAATAGQQVAAQMLPA